MITMNNCEMLPTRKQWLEMERLYHIFYKYANPHTYIEPDHYTDNMREIKERALKILTEKQFAHVKRMAEHDFNTAYDDYLKMIPESEFV